MTIPVDLKPIDELVEHTPLCASHTPHFVCSCGATIANLETTIEAQASLICEAIAKLRGLLDANGNMARNRAANEAEAFLRQLKGES